MYYTRFKPMRNTYWRILLFYIIIWVYGPQNVGGPQNAGLGSGSYRKQNNHVQANILSSA